MVQRLQGFSVGIAAIIILSASATAWAQDPIHKMGRGVVNVLTGWIEIPSRVHSGMRQDNATVGVARGVVDGVGMALLRVGVGLFEAVTFPIEYPKDFASPYEQMRVNDYAWE